MPIAINQEWLNTNASRAYPLREDSSRTPVDIHGVVIPGVQLPNYMIVDFVLTASSEPLPEVYIKYVACVGNLLTLSFYDSSDAPIALLTVNLDTHLANNAYSIIGSDTYDDARGKVVLGDLSRIKYDVPEGSYTFEFSATQLESSTIRPDLRGVRSLQVFTSTTQSEYLYGHVKLVAGNNVKLTYVPAYNAIRIDALSGVGLNADCDCGTGTGTTVQTINGIPIKDLVITGDGSCVDVVTSGNTITIADKCSTPCCGCQELELITGSLKILEVTVTNLQTYAMRLAERIDNFVTNYILTAR